MTEMSDLEQLDKMRRALADYVANVLNIEDLADNLLALRDNLQFVDADWYHDLTEHIVTLDSASTFSPTTDGETRELRHAIDTAVGGIGTLIRQKANELG